MTGRTLAGHVKLGDHQLVVDGEDFPWYVAPGVEVTETGHPRVPWLVHVEVIPRLVGTDIDLPITCAARVKQPPVIGDRPFPWHVSEDGYEIRVRKPVATMKCAFFAERFEDVRS